MRASETLASQMNLLKMTRQDTLTGDQHRFLAMNDEAATM